MPSGNSCLSSSIVARTSSESSQRVGAGRLVDADRDGVLVVEQRAQRVLGRAELDARHVAQARHLAVAPVLTTMSPNSSSVIEPAPWH